MFEPKHGIWAFFQEEFPNGQGAKRRKHVLRVFLALSVFLFLALVQWMIVLLALRDWSLSWFKENIVAVVLVYVFGVFLLLLFALSQHLRQLCFFNWLLVGIIVSGYGGVLYSIPKYPGRQLWNHKILIRPAVSESDLHNSSHSGRLSSSK
ncbi:uncharacterized protein LOC6507427 isoform X4 [Drosophila ananassae]|uniref:uncharacterized protein LOC6507427 isoform X4 n=1 Tax=Drosophila ananassae TaxID=7217 RepID=UPI001CFF9A3F|nr:uncharacterized protein LOC6507427 isoform X4 [Drosophila ananassae]